MVNRITSTFLPGESVTIDTVMSVYLYGTLTPPQALYDRIKPGDYVNSLPIHGDKKSVEFGLDGYYYMVSGAGRFARAAEFEIVGVFLDPLGPFQGLNPGSYTVSDLEVLGLSNVAGIQQLFRSDGVGNDVERALIYNNTGYKLDDSVRFVVAADGARYIENVQIRPFNDNFDFDGGSIWSAMYNFFNEGSFDPYGIGNRVEFQYNPNTAPVKEIYDYQSYLDDLLFIERTSTFPFPVAIPTDNEAIVSDLIYSGVLLFETSGFGIIYGTYLSNEISDSDLKNSSSANVLVLAGEGNDTVFGGTGGDRGYGHEGQDEIYGYFGDDSLFGGSGSDSLYGEQGNDRLYGDFSAENFLGAEESLSVGTSGSAGSIGSDDVIDGGAGNDAIYGGPGVDTMFGGDGADTVDGRAGEDTVIVNLGGDDIHGGLGGDRIVGGRGPDMIFDNGSGRIIAENETPEEYFQANLVPDADGNDTIFSGSGSDIIVLSGGTDSAYGGEGDDNYYITDPTGNATIYVSSDGQNDIVQFGHDVISGLTDGVDRIVFDGINRGDVQLRYDFDKSYFATVAYNFNPLFGWTIDPMRQDVNVWSLVGTLEIYVVSTGQSIAIENVSGSFSKPSGPGPATLTGLVDAPVLQFEDGILNVANKLIEGGINGDTYFTDAILSGTALDGLTSFSEERATPEDTIYGGGGGSGGGGSGGGGSTSSSSTGSNAANAYVGTTFADYARMRGGDDRLEGGLGGDTLDGGAGRDTATYANATEAVSAVLAPWVIYDNALFQTVQSRSAFAAGEALDDVFLSVENLEGSSFNDTLSGDLNSNTLLGGAGDDRLDSGWYGKSTIFNADDRVFGGAGNDRITSAEGNDLLDGGTGNDTLTTTGGNDTVFGGDGDDIVTIAESRRYVRDDPITILTSPPQSSTRPGFDYLTSGNDLLDGGAGTDTLTISVTRNPSTLAPIVPDGDALIDMVAGKIEFVKTGEVTRFVNFEHVNGDDWNDTILGDGQDSSISGGYGSDVLLGGAGNDTLTGGTENFGNNAADQDFIFGGSGIDTVTIWGFSTDFVYSYVNGGVRISPSGSTSSVTVFEDVEFIQFRDVTKTYAELAEPLQTAFAVVDDDVRVSEGATTILSPLANDLRYQNSPLTLLKINGTAVAVGDVLRLSSGATVKVLANGQLEFDQAGAWAGLDAGETGAQTLTYTATDATGIERSATFDVIVDGVASRSDGVHLSRNVVIASSDLVNASRMLVANFDIATTAVVINEVVINPNAPLPAGVTVQEFAGSTYISFGDDVVVLDDISYDAWKYVAAQRATGGTGNDSLNGTSASEVLFGGDGRDTINGNGGNDVISAGSGNDSIRTLIGDDIVLAEDGDDSVITDFGNDIVFGGAGNDILRANASDDILYGGGGNDQLFAGTDDDSLFGGSGNDILRGNFGRDVFDGGDGQDLVMLFEDNETPGTAGANVNLETGYIFWSGTQLFERISNVEDVQGTEQSDTIIGNEQNNSLNGYLGTDLVYGGGGNDTLNNTPSGDSIYIGSSSLYGGNGDDVILTFSGVSLIDGGPGNDTLDLSTFTYGFYNTFIDLSAGIAGNNQRPGQPSSIEALLVSIEHAVGNDYNNTIIGDAVANSLSGRAGNDTIAGQSGNDTLFGGSGNDFLDSGAGDDSLVGGSGNDTFVIESASDSVTELANEGTDLVLSSVDWALGANVENLTLTGSAVSGTGNVLANTILGNASANILSGGDGADILTGGEGNDTIFGGAGSDTAVFDANVGDVSILSGTNALVISGASIGTDTISNDVETIVFDGVSFTYSQLVSHFITTTANGVVNGTAAADTINLGFVDAGGESVRDSATLPDTVYAGTGNDIILLLAGNDLGYGGLGDDTISGGAGNDSLIGNQGSDSLSGDAGNDSLSGYDGGDVLDGGDGDDTLNGGAGTDTLRGGIGNDTYIVNDVASGDVIDESTGSGVDTVLSNDNFALGAGVENLTLLEIPGSTASGTGNALDNIITGNSGNNGLFGGVGADTLNGGGGNDTLNGGTGNDSMAGGAGDDTYAVTEIGDLVVEASSSGNDSVLSEISYTLTDSVENLTLASGSAALTAQGNSSGNTLSGNELGNLLLGLGGYDVLYGGSGNDTLDGGTLIDTLFGGTGDDTYLIADLTSGFYVDQVSEVGGGGVDVVQSGFNYALTSAQGDVENLTLVGTAWYGGGNGLANVITGTSADNKLEGFDGHDTLLGGDGNDSLDGGAGDDSLVGGLGNDVYVVDATGDILVEAAGSGIDTVQTSSSYTLGINLENLELTGTAAINGTGNVEANSLKGNSGANLLSGLLGNDTLTGGDGNDSLDGGADSDSLIGGNGDDFYFVDTAADIVVELSGTGSGNDTVNSSITWNLGNDVENLTLSGSAAIDGTGNTLANRLTGNASNNSLFGLDGNDTLDGGGGTDTLDGGLGNDTYLIDTSTDMIIEAAGGGADFVQSSVNYVLGSELENLTLIGSAVQGTGNLVSNLLTGTVGANILSGLAGNDSLFGGDGDDTLDGGTGNDSLVGGLGNDTYIVDATTDVVVEVAGGGADSVQSSITLTLGTELENLALMGSAAINGTGNGSDNVLAGNIAANSLSGAAGNDTLFGYDGNDTLDGGTGDDSLVGGVGNDTYTIDSASDVVFEAAGGGTDSVNAAFSYALGTEVENLTLTGSSSVNGTGNTLANVLTGNTGHNVLSGLDGNDTLSGGAGNDTLDGGAGTDSLIGGSGNDTFIVDATGDVVVEAASGGTDLVQSTASFTLSSEVENLILLGVAAINGTGNGSANTLIGNTAANLISGAAGNDTIFGGDGNDTLDGGTGIDSLVGGLGNDTYVVDVATDVIVEAAGGGTDLVQSAITLTLGTDLENLTLTGTGAINGTGNGLSNVLTGNTGANTLSGLVGNDSLFGLGGNDTLTGGDGDDLLDGGSGTDRLVGELGNDTYVVDATTDVIVEAAGGGIDLAQSSVTLTLVTEVENLTLIGSAAINGTGNTLANILTGNSGANLLSGAAGNDTIFGGDGNDTLDGGTGNDSLVGGLGNDTYVIDATTDVIVEVAGGGIDLVQSALTLALAAEVENLTLTGTAAINGTGNGLANLLTGNTAANSLSGMIGDDRLFGLAGNDTLDGGAGNDSLDGGTGNDSLIGGSGDDIYVVDVTTDIVVEAASGGIDLVQSSVTLTLGTEVENLTLTGTGAINGTGNALANRLTGNSGINTLSGGNGNDTIDGGAGNDVLTGGIGADQFVFTSASGVDTITDFNQLDGGADEFDVMRFEGLGVGTFVYRGTSTFTGGSDNSEARVSGNQVLVDTNGDGVTDITITLTGLTSATQIAADDFLFV